jgi:hypothetical protein
MKQIHGEDEFPARLEEQPHTIITRRLRPAEAHRRVTGVVQRGRSPGVSSFASTEAGNQVIVGPGSPVVLPLEGETTIAATDQQAPVAAISSERSTVVYRRGTGVDGDRPALRRSCGQVRDRGRSWCRRAMIAFHGRAPPAIQSWIVAICSAASGCGRIAPALGIR